jgi:hypothetical protein
MAPTALLNAFMYVDDWDATGDSNSMEFTGTQPALDGTTFRSGGWEEVGGSGQKKVNFGFNGFWSAATTAAQDPQSFDQLGVGGRVFTAYTVETETGPAFLWKGGQFDYQAFGQINTAAPFSIQSTGTDGIGVVRGQLAAAKQTKSATGQLGSACLLGAPTSTQYVYATFHVFSAGTTITVQVQSDDNSGFTSATTRATIGPLTVAGGTYLTRVAGPFVGETYWRFNVSAITGTFSVAGAIAVA